MNTCMYKVSPVPFPTIFYEYSQMSTHAKHLQLFSDKYLDHV